MYDILIVGAGPAGMTAAIYARRGEKKTIMIDKMSYGGQIINTPEIENYPGFKLISGMEFANTIYKQATDLGAEMDYGNVNSIEEIDGGFLVKTDMGKEYQTKTVILATGAKNRPIGLPKEQQLTGAGISYCATCDGAFFRNRTVAVLGGGNTALEDAEVLAGLASKVYLIHRRDKFRGDELTVERLQKKDNVEFILDTVPVELLGDMKLEGLKLKNVKTEEETELPLDGVFVAYGQIPENEAFANIVNLNKAGYIDAGEDCLTNKKGIFTAGDCRTKKVRQIVTATGDGSTAALEAIEYLNSLE